MYKHMRGRKKEEVITIRVSKNMKNSLKEKCDNINVSMSEFIIDFLEKTIITNDKK